MTGTDKSIFKIANRLVPFTIINPSLDLPYVVSFDLPTITPSSITVAIQTNKDCTFYYWIGPKFARPVSLEQIKQKSLPYDYFNYRFLMGEFV
jgi:hypothetical protein